MSIRPISFSNIPNIIAIELVGRLAEFEDGKEEDENDLYDSRQEPVQLRRYLSDCLHIYYKPRNRESINMSINIMSL